MQESFYVGLHLGLRHCYQIVIKTGGALVSARLILISKQNFRLALARLEASQLSV